MSFLKLHHYLFAHDDEYFELNLLQKEYLRHTGILIKTHNYPLFQKNNHQVYISWKILMMMLSNNICFGDSYILGPEKFIKLGDIIEFSSLNNNFSIKITVTNLHEQVVNLNYNDIPSDILYKIKGSCGERQKDDLSHPSSNPDVFYKLHCQTLVETIKKNYFNQLGYVSPTFESIYEQLKILNIIAKNKDEIERGLNTHGGYVYNPTNSVIFLRTLNNYLSNKEEKITDLNLIIKKSLVSYYQEISFIEKCKTNLKLTFNQPIVISTYPQDKVFKAKKLNLVQLLWEKIKFYHKFNLYNPFKKHV